MRGFALGSAAARGALVSLALVTLAGCGFLAYPAPEEPQDVNRSPQSQYQAQPQPQPQARVQAAAPAPSAVAPQPPACAPSSAATPGTEIVQRGETLYQVSRCNKVPIRALIDANHLEPPYVLQAGQKLVIPHPQTHTVAAGETLYGIARQNGVDVSALVRENGLNPPYNVFVGQTLIMPGKIATAASAPTVPASPREIRQVESLPPQTHPAVATSASPEPMPTPPPTAKVAAAQPKTAEIKTPEAPVETPVPTPPPEQVASIPSAREAPAKEMPKTAASAEAETPAAIPTGKSRFIWPVKGKILSAFGSKSGGLFNDGINIAVPAGTDVRAADSGVVVYAGNEIRGFGNLVLIKHPNGWMTAYGHNEQLLVHRGEQVQRGQAIAKSGSTGTVSTPQLHFEIRRGSHAVDPTQYLAQLAG